MKLALNLDYEQRLWQRGTKRVAGVDEVGRGSVAGPVVAACVMFAPTHQPIPGINDSKKLTATMRERLAREIKQQAVFVKVGLGSVEMVDGSGIIAATSFAMKQAAVCNYEVMYVDGPAAMGLDRAEPIVKGDCKVYSVAAASIVAKVYRDELMTTLHPQFPVYLWDRNKGYGTKEHFAAIAAYGLTIHHRRSFLVPGA